MSWRVRRKDESFLICNSQEITKIELGFESYKKCIGQSHKLWVSNAFWMFRDGVCDDVICSLLACKHITIRIFYYLYCNYVMWYHLTMLWSLGAFFYYVHLLCCNKDKYYLYETAHVIHHCLSYIFLRKIKLQKWITKV